MSVLSSTRESHFFAKDLIKQNHIIPLSSHPNIRTKKKILLLGAMTTVDSMSTPSYSTLRPVVSTGIIQPTLTGCSSSRQHSSTAPPPHSSLLLIGVCMPLALREHPAHIATDSLVVEQILNAANSRNGDILVPNLLLRKSHDVLGGNGIDGTLNLARARAAAGCDNLATNILGQGSGAIQRQQDGSLQLGLGTLGLGLGNGLRKA